MDKKELFMFATLAEECGELAQQAGKCIRFTRNSKKEAKLIEELADIIAVSRLLNIHVDEARISMKMERLTKQAECYETYGTGDCEYGATLATIKGDGHGTTH